MGGWSALPRAVALGVMVLVLLSGCATRSISNSGYPGQSYNPLYHGELSEFDVIGVDPTSGSTDAAIAHALDMHRKPVLRRGDAIMLIQSGALLPDDAMLQAMAPLFDVKSFSGVPLTRNGVPQYAAAPAVNSPDYSSALRMAAARAGAETIVCYWGVLESARAGEASKLVSWVPVVGSVVPDETQRMRIRLRMIVVDVRSGGWAMFSPDALDDAALSASINRESSDQDQVARLKLAAYKAATSQLIAQFSP